ncbi:MAG TPA: hypothetical protein VNH38_01495 [Candidatus Dormibacteraeota bacterium]|nr:hypothetical protein [Candidatus Dormibacteraeota bacterium]
MSLEVQAPPEYQTNPAPPGSTDPQPLAATEVGPRPQRPRKASAWRGFRVSELILLSVAVVDAFLALDFVFRASAVGGDGFVSVVDRVGGALASPFAGIFRPGVPSVGHTTFWAALLAVAIYTVAALVLVRLIHLVSSPLRRRVQDA